MQASEVPRAVAAAVSTASSVDLTVDDAIVLHDSNRLTLRLLPCDVLARVAPGAHQTAQFEVELAQRLAESESPVAALEPRVEPRVHERDGFVVTLWTYHEPVTLREVSPADYANALVRLHAGMRKLDIPTPHFTDRVEQAQQLVANRDHTPALADVDRELLGDTLRSLRRVIGERGGAEQLLHGEPHPGNLLTTKHGLLSSERLRVERRGSGEASSVMASAYAGGGRRIGRGWCSVRWLTGPVAQRSCRMRPSTTACRPTDRIRSMRRGL